MHRYNSVSNEEHLPETTPDVKPFYFTNIMVVGPKSQGKTTFVHFKLAVMIVLALKV